jgi:hypothetical protein
LIGPAKHLDADRNASLEGEHDNTVHAAIVDAGDAGLTLMELEERTGLRNRVLQNVTWRLEVKQRRVHRLPGTRPCRKAPGIASESITPPGPPTYRQR